MAFWYRLAGHLKRPVRLLQQEIDSLEFAHWKSFCQRFEPFGDEWRRAAIIAAAIVNANGGRDGRAIHAEDFMPLFPMDPTDESVAFKIKIAALQDQYCKGK